MNKSQSTFIRRLVASAGRAQRRLALPESTDPRVLEATRLLIELGAVHTIMLFGEKDQILSIANQHGVKLQSQLSHIVWARPSDQVRAEQTRAHFLALAQSKGKSYSENEAQQLASGVLEQAASALAAGEVDAVVAGSLATTAEVIRAALRGVGLAKGNKTLSSCFAMVREREGASLERFIFADCGVVVEPSAEQLVDIAAATVQTFRALFPKEDPIVAFLSFSSKGSAQHPNASKMATAAAAFKAQFPEIISDGELQFDAAYIEAIGQRKAPGSLVPGRANCFIFPDLGAGNIAYKITERLAGFSAYGPILQGCQKPFHDLSRGATAEDIVVSSLIALLQAETSV